MFISLLAVCFVVTTEDIIQHELADTGRNVVVVVYIPDRSNDEQQHFRFDGHTVLDAVVPLGVSVVDIDTRTIREQLRRDIDKVAIPTFVDSLCREWLMFTWIDRYAHTWTILTPHHKPDGPSLGIDMRRAGRRCFLRVRKLEGGDVEALAPRELPWYSPLRLFCNFTPKELEVPIYEGESVVQSLGMLEQNMAQFAEQFGDYHLLRNNCHRHSAELQKWLGAIDTSQRTRSFFANYFWS